MPTALLKYFFTPLRYLSGVGEKNALKFAKLLNVTEGSPQIIDLLQLQPYNIVNRDKCFKISELEEGNIATLEVEVVNKVTPTRGNSKIPLKMNVADDTGHIQIIYFNRLNFDPFAKFTVGDKIIISGKIEKYKNIFAMPHPDYILPIAQKNKLPKIEVIYPATAGLSSRQIANLIQKALDNLPDLPEWIPANIMAKYNFPSYKEALLRVHNPKNIADINIENPWFRRLAFDEFFANQFALALTREEKKSVIIRDKDNNKQLIEAMLAKLPYQLTNSQRSAIEEIFSDLKKNTPMLRLLQGDVGSGKTIVAIFAMLKTLQHNGQVAFMAPTESLAQQHYKTIKKLTENLNISVELLTGRTTKTTRSKILSALSKGEIDILVGTHAIIQKDIIFSNLQLSIIDEQHKFGTNQRLQLSSLQANPDTLFLTATPIPRSMVLATLGNMDVSQLREKPANRKPINTVALPMEKIAQLMDKLKNIIEKGQQSYWVCPLIDESEKLDLTAAQHRYNILSKIFGDKVAIVHGKMKGAEKDKVMQDFISGKINILVSTTVVEVGIDVANATVMIIENAERFGLAQLHQLRGRVGRNDLSCSCILLYQAPLSPNAYQRLNIMKKSEDGFLIAEKDLELRGEGELLGTKQSGMPNFIFAQAFFHRELLIEANKLAKELVSKGQKDNITFFPLYLFKKHQAINFLRAG